MVRPDESSPLVPKGFGLKFLEDSQDKFLANEDENAYVQLEIFGDPAPNVTWMKGNVDLGTLDRFQSWTCGKKGFAFLGVECAQKEDEGVYKCVIQNRFGKREHKFKLFIARSWQSRPAPPKKEVPIYWSEIPRSKFIKEGHKDTVFFTAKLTVANKNGTWTFNGQECKNGDKYEIHSGGGNFTIGVKNPVHADTGCYRCSLLETDLSCETYLDVQLPDPEYSFLRPLDSQYHGYTGRSIKMTCLASPDAKIAWFKDLKQLKSGNDIKITAQQGEHVLLIENLTLQHNGYFECRIFRFGKEGADFCGTEVKIQEFPHKISRKMAANIELVERNDLILQVCTEEKDAEVQWFKDNKQIQLERKRHQRIFLSHNENSHQLKIAGVTVTDSGLYTAKTNCDSSQSNVIIEEYPFLFCEKLPSQVSVMEGGRINLEVKVKDEEAEVEWFLNGVKLETSRSRASRLQTTSYGLSRTLQIKNTDASDSGILSARTNKDVSETKLQVKCHNSFVQRLPDILEVPHNAKVEFTVKTRDVFAPVYFFLDRLAVELEDGSIEQEDDGMGNHKLIIYKVQTTDAGLLCCKTPSNRGDEMLQSKCILNVSQGESPPVLGPADPVSCCAILHSYSERMNSYIHKEQCRLIIPYKIEGTRMSTLDILVERDGYPVEVGNEIQLRVQTDKIIIDVMNPVRMYSGLYKVTMSNEQGSGSIEVPVSIMDIPAPPRAAWVDNVFKNSVTVFWKEPSDDGGCEIKHYIVEGLDLTMGNVWASLAMTDTGDNRSIEAGNLSDGHRYMFRVSAVNKVGQSEPVDVKGATLVKDPWECPGECGKCIVIDWMPTFADLTWMKPGKDGGAPITSYIIQLKEKSMREWIDSIEIPVEELEIEGNIIKGRCENLVEEYEYMFRVLAVNKGGKGKPGAPSQSVIAMYKNIPPTIKEGKLVDLKIKEGRSIRFDVWIAGEPAPTIEWLRNDEKIVTDEKTFINIYTKSASVYTLKNVVLSIPKALEEDHTGVYKLRLMNISGVFESVAEVIIEGPPGKQKKVKKEEKKQEAEKDEEKEPVLETIRKLSTEGKEEDKDSGLKIGEESLPDSDESVWTEYTDSDELDNIPITPEADIDSLEEQRDNSYNSKHHSNSTLKSKSDKELVLSQDVSEDEGVEGVEINDNDLYFNTINDEYKISNKEYIETNKIDHEEYKSTSKNVSENVEDHEIINEIINENIILDDKLNQCTNNSENIYIINDSEIVLVDKSDSNERGPLNDYQLKESIEKDSAIDDKNVNIKVNTVEQGDLDYQQNKQQSGQNENMWRMDENYDETNNTYSSVKNEISQKIDYQEPQSTGHITNSRTEQSGGTGLKLANDCGNDEDSIDESQNTESEKYLESNALTNEEMEVNEERQAKEEKKKLEELAKKEERQRKEKQRQDELQRLDELVKEEERLKKQVAIERERKRQERIAEEARLKEEQEKEERRKKEEKMKNEALFRLEQDNLSKRLEHLGFIRSKKAADFDYTNGEGVLISLLDQMNRDDQNFKVWDREDYPFLRWYLTRQMEAYIMKDKELPFMKLIDGDKLSFIERITEDNVHLDETFLNAAASVFNKDIIIIPADEKEDVKVLYGGPGTTKGKGTPLYLGYVKPIGQTIPPQYYSIMQDTNSKINFVYGESIDRKISVIANGEPIASSPKMRAKDDRKRSWKRMDSYTGRDSKDMDAMINSIMAEENMEELFNKLDSCENESISNEQIKNENFEEESDMNNNSEVKYTQESPNVNSKEDNNQSSWNNEQQCAKQETTFEDDNMGNEEGTCSNEEESTAIFEDTNTYNYNYNQWGNYYGYSDNNETNEDDNFESDEASHKIDDNTASEHSNNEVNKNNITESENNYADNYVKDSKEHQVVDINLVNKENDDNSYEWYYESSSNTKSEEEEYIDNDVYSHEPESECVDSDLKINEIHNDLRGWYDDSQQNNDSEIKEVNADENGAQENEDSDNIDIEISSQQSNDDSGWYSNASASQYKSSHGWYYDTPQDEEVIQSEIETIAKDSENEGSQETYGDSREATPVNEVREATPVNEVNNEQEYSSTYQSDANNLTLNNSDNEVEIAADLSTQDLCFSSKNKMQEDTSISNSTNQNIPTLTSLDNLDFCSPFGNANQNEAPQTGVKMRRRRHSRRTTPEISISSDDGVQVKENGVTKRHSTDDKENISTMSSINSLDISSPFGSTNQDEAPQQEVKLRQRRYSRRKSTTSFRWSADMDACQIDGSTLDLTADNGDSQKSEEVTTIEHLKEKLSNNMAKYGLKEAIPLQSRCKDSCLVSLMDQMMLAGEDFKVWDKDDHTFLSWYIIKQMDSQISTGKASTFLNLEKKYNEDIETTFKSSNPTKSDYFVHAFARVFNRDIIVMNSEGDIQHLHGGVNSKPGKGKPFILGVVKDSKTGDIMYQSLEPNVDCERDSIIDSLISKSCP